jgi:hypothetical protein
MLLKRTVTLKVVVTEEFKQQYRAELKKAADQIGAAQQQLQFQADRLISEVAKTNLEQATAVRRQFDLERQKQDRAKAEIMVEMQKAAQLEIGSEFERGPLEGYVEVKTGDDLESVLGGAELLVKDGKVVEIRDPAEKRT